MFIVKIGGSVVSDKNRKYHFSNKNLKNVARQLKKFRKTGRKKLIIVTGAGSVGHTVASSIKQNKQMEHFAKSEKPKVFHSCRSFTSAKSEQSKIVPSCRSFAFAKSASFYDKYFDKIRDFLIAEGLPVVGIRSAAFFSTRENKIRKADTAIIEKMLKMGVIPLFSADFCIDTKNNMSMVSADDISAFLAKRLKAKKVIMVTDVDGVYKNGLKDREVLKSVKSIKDIKTTVKRYDVSGGIRRKLKLLLTLSRGGVKSQIVNGLKSDDLYQALSGKGVGTTFKQKNKKKRD